MLSLIPVLDLMQGCAVRAVRGERQAYQPLRSPLCPDPDPVDVAGRLLEAAGRWPGVDAARPTLYLADLDALTGGKAQREVLVRLLEALPALSLWVDAGFRDAEDARRLRTALPATAQARVRWVFGSESLRDAAALRQACAPGQAFEPDTLLSLDHRGGRPLDPAGCAAHPAWWPDDVIVMCLDRVGTGLGPDLQRLHEARRQAPGRRWIGAGGVRDAADLAEGAAAGAQAWLVASALHDLRLP